jgi:hypothetical protein
MRKSFLNFIIVGVLFFTCGTVLADSCVIRFWGCADYTCSSYWITTSQQSKTQEAALELFHFMFDYSIDPYGEGYNPSFVDGCYVYGPCSRPADDCYYVCTSGSWSYNWHCGFQCYSGGGGGWDVVCGPETDTDGDGVMDIADNCPDVYNPGQEDSNGNGIGDACEPVTTTTTAPVTTTTTTLPPTTTIITTTTIQTAECQIEWWGDRSGSVSTLETSRTRQAAEEAYGAIQWYTPLYCSESPSWDEPYYENCYAFYCTIPLAAYDSRYVCLSGTWAQASWEKLDCLEPPCYEINGNWDVVCEFTVIQLSSFTATSKSGKIVLQWGTESEIDNAGFNLYSSKSERGKYIKINDSLIPAQGSTTQGAFYEFVDKDVKNRKTYWYKLEDIDINGNSTMHGPVSATPRWILGIFGLFRK